MINHPQIKQYIQDGWEIISKSENDHRDDEYEYVELNVHTNPDLVKMFDYCHNNAHNPGVIPNLTVHGGGLTDEWIATLAKYIGGIAVSLYSDKELCYNSVERLSKAGIVQVNIHKVISEETLSECFQLVEDAATDQRLKEHLKAVMFLTLKPMGKRNKFHTCKDVTQYKKLINRAMELGVQIGFDSCSAPTFLMSLKDDPNFDKYAEMVESCESSRMSGYANVKGEWWHCSFSEEHPRWKSVNLLEVEDFMKDVWNHPEVLKFRDALVSQDNKHICSDCYLCPSYSLYAPEIGDASGSFNVIELKKVA